jgi:hypothetical protein
MLMPRWFGSMASVCVSVSNHLCVPSVSQASGIVERPGRQLDHWCSRLLQHGARAGSLSSWRVPVARASCLPQISLTSLYAACNRLVPRIYM